MRRDPIRKSASQERGKQIISIFIIILWIRVMLIPGRWTLMIMFIDRGEERRDSLFSFLLLDIEVPQNWNILTTVAKSTLLLLFAAVSAGELNRLWNHGSVVWLDRPFTSRTWVLIWRQAWLSSTIIEQAIYESYLGPYTRDTDV